MNLKKLLLSFGFLLLFFAMNFSSNAQITIPPHFEGDSVNVPSGSSVIVPFRVFNFQDIIGMQGSIHFDTSLVRYQNLQDFATLPGGFDLAKFGINRRHEGVLTYVWSDPTLNGGNLPDSTILFSISFTAIGSAGNLTFINFTDTPTARQVTDSSFTILSPTYSPGKVNIVGAGSFSISTNSISPTTYCAGDNISVSFVANGNYNSNNVFSLQISDVNGSFIGAKVIGTLAGTSSGTINATIPPNTAFSPVYRFRVVANNPQVLGTDNGADIVINALPNVTFGMLNPTCENAMPFSLNTGMPAGGTYSGTGVSGGNQFDPSLSGIGNFLLTYSFTSPAGCSNSAQQNQVVNPKPPTPTIVQSGDSLLSNIPLGNQWLRNGLPIAGATDSIYQPTQMGNYSVVTNLNGCTSDTSNVIVYVGIEDLKKQANIKLFPNPSNGNFQVSWDESFQPTEILIINNLGQIVYSEAIKQENQIFLNLNLSVGIYDLRFTVDDLQFTVYGLRFTIYE